MPQYQVAAPVAPAGPQNAPRPDPGARGFQVDPSQLVRSMNPAQADPRGFIAEAGASLGPAIQSLGEQGTKLYQAHVDSVTKEQVLNAEAGLDVARTNIAAKLAAEPNTLKWQEIAGEEASKQIQAVLSDKDLTPEAKAHITGMYNRWQMTEVAQVGLQSAKEQAKRTAEAGVGSIIELQRQGRYGEADVRADELVEQNIIPKDTGERIKTHNQEEFQKNSFLTAVQIDPEKALKIANDPKYDVKPEFRAWAQHTATAGVRAQTAATIDGLDNFIASETFVSREQVKAYADKNPLITPEMVQNAYKQVDALNSAAHQQWKVNNSDTNIARAMGAVRGYDPKTDPDMKQYDALNSWIHRNLVTGDEGVASTALKSRLAGHAAPEEKDPRMKDVTDTLNTMQSRGDFGVFKTPSVQTVTQKDANGDEVTLHKQVTQIDLKKQAAAEDARVKVEAHMRGWMKQNPDANQSQILTEMTRVTPGHLTAGALDQLDGVSSPMQTPPGSLSMTSPAEGPLQTPETVTTGKKEPLPEDPGRAPKAQTAPESKTDDNGDPIADPGEDKTPKGSADTGVNTGSLFPADKSGVVGGDSMFGDLGQAEGDLPPDREKKKKQR